MASHMLKIMREEATCSICLKLMTEPMIIDCGHSYCRVCIMDIPESKSVTLSQRTYSCPQCQVQIKNVSLRPNKQLQNLIETIKEMDLETVCEEHREQLHLFCEDDGQLICWCCARSPQHKGHVTLLVDDACQVYKKKLQETVEKLKELEDKCNNMKLLTKKHITECVWKIVNQKQIVQSAFMNLKNFLHEEEKSHLWKLEKEREKVLKRLRDGEASLEKQSQELQNYILQLEEKCQGSAEMLLRDVKDTLDRTSSVRLELPETVPLSLDVTCNVSELYFDVKKIAKSYQGSSVSASSHGSVPISESSRICPELDKKPEGSWICELCLVQNNSDCTKCVGCNSARPGMQSEYNGFGTSSLSSNSAASVFKFGIPSSSSGPTQSSSNTGNFKFGDQGGSKIGVSPDSGPTNFMNESFKFSKSMGDFKLRISSDSKPEEANDSNTDDNFKFGFFDSLSDPASVTSFQFGVYNLGQQVKKEEPLKPSTAAFGFDVATANSTKLTSGRFSFGTPETKKAAPFTWKKSEAKKELPTAKACFTFNNTEPISLPSAPLFVLGRTGDKQQAPATSISQVFGKNTNNEKAKCQPLFSFGLSKQIKDESSSKPTFSFSTAKPFEKKTEQPMKATFAFGDQTKATADPGAINRGFSFLNSNSSNSSTTAPSAGSGIFGGSTTSSTVPRAAFQFGQASSTLSVFAFGNSAEPSTSQSSLFSQKSKPGPGFQFGSCQTISNSQAVRNNNPLVSFSFGGNQSTSAASAQPSGSGPFAFNQAPAAFTVGSNGKNIFSSGTSVSDRKTKTPVRHRK